MATRMRLTHQDDVRTKIQTSQLVNRLMSHILGEVELSATQVSAAMGLLKKTLPDLAVVGIDSSDDVQGLIADIIAQRRQRVAAMNDTPEVSTHG
jgi:hypothetical protein